VSTLRNGIPNLLTTVTHPGYSPRTSTDLPFLIKKVSPLRIGCPPRSDAGKGHHSAPLTLTNGDLPRVTLVLSDRCYLFNRESGVTMRRGVRPSLTLMGEGGPLCASYLILFSLLSPGPLLSYTAPQSGHPDYRRGAWWDGGIPRVV